MPTHTIIVALQEDDLGDHNGAIKDYDKAIELNPNDIDAYYNRGIARSDLGDHNSAIEDYDKVIELKPYYANAYNNRGVLQEAI